MNKLKSIPEIIKYFNTDAKKLGATALAALGLLTLSGCNDDNGPTTKPAFAELGDTLGGTVHEICPSADAPEIYEGVAIIVHQNQMATDRLQAGTKFKIPTNLCEEIGTKDVVPNETWLKIAGRYAE